MILFLSIVSLIAFSLIVFGGGQVFMPLFKWLWVDLAHLMDTEKAQNVFTIANATPGPFSTKLSLISGYFSANGEWWGFLLMFVTYILFITPAMIVMMYVANKFFKFESSRTLQTGIKYTRPIIVGIMISLVFSIVLSGFFPELSVYFKNTGSSSKTDFINSHLIQIIVWSVVSFGISLYTILKKYNLIIIILSNLIVGFVIFII